MKELGVSKELLKDVKQKELASISERSVTIMGYLVDPFNPNADEVLEQFLCLMRKKEHQFNEIMNGEDDWEVDLHVLQLILDNADVDDGGESGNSDDDVNQNRSIDKYFEGY